MKQCFIFTVLICVALASTDEELWMKFKNDHGKTYKNLREEKIRFEVFKSNLQLIEEHNRKYERGEESWAMKINRFADITDQEFKIQYLSSLPEESVQATTMFKPSLNASVPDSIDWREKAVLSVKDQGDCGGCYAFSAAGALEGQNALKHNIRIDLSPQEIVDCSRGFENLGCTGGWMNWAFDYIKKYGISTLTSYPYLEKEEKCKGHLNSSKIVLKSYSNVSPLENFLKEAVATVGPISVAINADTIRFYSHGIFNNIFCSSRLNHAALAVGYGIENGKDYWLIKNSWGTKWGEDGYIKMTRNLYNQCGIASRASYPNIA